MNAKFMALAVAALLAFAALAPDDAVAQRAVPDTLDKIRAAKQINVAFSADSAPFSSVGDGNQPAGYSIDLCRKVLAQIGLAVGEPNLKVNWLAGTVSERLAMVASGKADLECANTTETQTRLKDVDFSNRIFIDGADKIKLVGLATQAKDPGLFVMLAEELSYEPLAFALPRGDSALRLEINRALTQVYVSGENEPIFVQWLGHLGRPSGLLAAMYLPGAIPQ